MRELISQYIGEWGWLIVVAAVGLTLKDTIRNLLIGLQFLWGSDFNIDDIVYINGNKRARIVRQNIWKTTFYVYDHNRKFVVPNSMVWRLHLEKDLPVEGKDI